MSLLHPHNFYPYQRRAVEHQLNNPRSMLFLFLGAGKTPITLTTINHLKRHGFIKGSLVVAPKRVAQSVWHREARKWSHLRHMTFSHILGTAQERIAAVFRPADVHVINYENLPWLEVQLQHYLLSRDQPLPWQFLCLDESSKVKNAQTHRVEALESLLPSFPWRTGLTGTPASNGLIDLHGQYRVIDDGQRLGINVSDYRRAYFKSTGYGGYGYECTNEDAIHRAIADITLEMSADDYANLPDFIVHDVLVDMEPKHRVQYEQMEKEFFLELEGGADLEVENEAAKINKLLQISNGFVYTNTETREWSKLHESKLEALDDIIEEAAGEPILLGYIFRPDAELIQKKYPYAVNLTRLPGKQFNQAIDDFAAGKIKLLIGHPASMGHGIDSLQAGSHIMVWFGIPWSLELYQQMNARLHRTGQGQPVRCYRILGRQTMDLAVAEALGHKDVTQKTLREAIKTYRLKMKLDKGD